MKTAELTAVEKAANALRLWSNAWREFDKTGKNKPESFEKVIDSFFTKYFTQAFLRSSGISQYLENPVLYKKNLTTGKKSGKSKGLDVGYRWIANAGLLNG